MALPDGSSFITNCPTRRQQKNLIYAKNNAVYFFLKARVKKPKSLQ
jgi:hypothetical protein